MGNHYSFLIMPDIVSKIGILIHTDLLIIQICTLIFCVKYPAVYIIDFCFVWLWNMPVLVRRGVSKDNELVILMFCLRMQHNHDWVRQEIAVSSCNKNHVQRKYVHLLRKPEYSRGTRYKQTKKTWMLMSWILASPGHQQPRHWLYKLTGLGHQ